VADTKISALTAASTLDGTELYAADQGGNSRKVSGAQIQTMVLRAGSATAGSWPILGSGTVLTSPAAGALEYDGTAFYFDTSSTSRGVVSAEAFCSRTTTKTMTSNTSLQAIFDQAPATNGTLTLPGSTSYFFECFLNVSSMSATSGNAGFSIVGGGTAGFTSAAWFAVGLDATTQTTAAAVGGISAATNAATGNIVTAAAGTAMFAFIKGIFRISTAGTIIPSIQLTTAASAVIGVNTFFRCYPIGSNTVVAVGNWS